MSYLTEGNLMRKAWMYFLLPWLIGFLLACFFPYAYAFIPAHESDLCVCAFYRSMYENNANFLLMKSNLSYRVI